MEKLSELDDLVLLVNTKNNPFDNYSTVKDKTILAIAEAFRALEQRAEAAEAKLAELKKQEPVACKKRLVNHRSGVVHHWRYQGEVDKPSSGDTFRVEVVPLYAHAAPTANLAELLPDVEKWRSPEAVRAQMAYRAAILRNIEEISK